MSKNPPGSKHDLIQRFSLALKDLPSTTPVLLGFSGGRDSTVLFDLLKRCNYSEIILCHLNHGLRGNDADGDQEFACQIGRESETRVIYDKVTVARSSASLEADARELRFDFLAKTAAQTGIHDVLLGHHADDQAETFLWNLLRGSGGSGLAAMQRMSTMRVGSVTLRLHRPLLSFWRTEIDAYIRARGLKFREDASNSSTDFTRNKLRLEIIPWLEKELGRNVRQPLWRAAEIAQAENAWLKELTGEWLDPGPLQVSDFANQPLAWQRRRIQAWLLTSQLPKIGFDEVEAVRSLLDPQSGPARINLPGNWQARRRAGKISVTVLRKT